MRIGGAGKWPLFRRQFWILFLKKKNFFASSSPEVFIWGSIFFCTMNGFFRILEKTSSEILCTRLYLCLFLHKIYLIFYPFLENSTTHIAIVTSVEKPFQQMEVCKPMWKLFISKLALSNVKFVNRVLQMFFICENIWEKFIRITICKFKINNVWFMSFNSKPYVKIDWLCQMWNLQSRSCECFLFAKTYERSSSR